MKRWVDAGFEPIVRDVNGRFEHVISKELSRIRADAQRRERESYGAHPGVRTVGASTAPTKKLAQERFNAAIDVVLGDLRHASS